MVGVAAEPRQLQFRDRVATSTQFRAAGPRVDQEITFVVGATVLDGGRGALKRVRVDCFLVSPDAKDATHYNYPSGRRLSYILTNLFISRSALISPAAARAPRRIVTSCSALREFKTAAMSVAPNDRATQPNP